MPIKQTRRSMLKGVALTGTVTLGSTTAITQSRADHSSSTTNLEIKGQNADRSSGGSRYEVWTTGEIRKDGSTEPDDSVYNSGDTHYAEGTIRMGTGKSDYYEFEGQAIKFYVERASWADDTSWTYFIFDNDLDYTGHDCIDIIGYNGSSWGCGWNSVQMNCTGSFEKPGDGSLESCDTVDGSYADSQTEDGGHDHFEMNGEFTSMRMSIGGAETDNPGEIKLERELGCSW